VTRRSYTVVDAFAAEPLEGNPVAVFDDGSGLSTETMQRTARELNLSETVFMLPSEAEADARLRIFTPNAELPFAGHPVLGTAFIVGERSGSETVRLETGVGVVPLQLWREDGGVTYARMDQPIPPVEPFPRERELLAALRLARSELPIEAYRNGPVHVYVALADRAQLAELRPDFAALEDLGDEYGINCFAGEQTRYETRMFAPALGVREDPATGSAAGPLALHLVRHGRIGFGERIEIRQGVRIGRPSVLFAQADGGEGHVERVTVGGGAVIVARGEYRLE
jgi:trans-2,3-dihydro-3-hydroxyanthranilate isomerase